ncbi:MAG: hypothetical protein RMJ43_12190 [Chloroherpetonaceae bacterium]|nr:hypothetical protein [Chloroherpetonaceae bacterium]
MKGYTRFCPAVLFTVWMLCTVPLATIAREVPGRPFGPVLPLPGKEPRVQVVLNRSVYRIRIDPKTGAPVMPGDIRAFASVVGWPGGIPHPQVFTWRVLLSWDFAPFPTRHSIGDRLFVQPSPLEIDLSAQVRGGTLKVFAKTWLQGREIVGMAQAQVLGENPPREIVLRSFPRDRFGLLASKIAMVESRMRQFSEGDERSPGGYPLLSRSNDVGLMQLSPSGGGLTAEDQVWDWRANLQRGLEMLAGKRVLSSLASRHATGRGWIRGPDEGVLMLGFLNAMRLVLGLDPLPALAIPPLSSAPGSGIQPGEEDPDGLALSQMERDAVRRYNGGREYEFVVVPDLMTLGVARAEWQIDRERGGVAPDRGDPDYVRRVLMARSGLTLPPPAKSRTPRPARP